MNIKKASTIHPCIHSSIYYPIIQRYLSIVLLSLLCFFLGQQDSFGQISFTYDGRKGKNSGGEVKIEYLLDNGGRVQKLEGDVIDLNDYGSGVKLIVRFSELKVGLKTSGFGVRKKEDYMRFYMRATHQKASVFSIIGGKTVKIGAKTANYGELTDQLTYRINPITGKRRVTVRIKIEIVDAKTEETWNVINISESFTITPRASDIANSVWRPIKKSWEAFSENPTGDLGKTLLEHCTEYLRNCEDGSGSCRNAEDALFYSIMATRGKQQRKYINDYKEKYGKKGKYLEAIAKIPKEVEPEIPIEAGAKLDFDENYLIINNVKGGRRNYWVKFFNNGSGDSIPVKSVDFAKEYVFIDFESLNIDEGFYTVKVTDKNNKLFIERDQVYISKALQLHPSIKFGGVLLLLGAIGFTYKKFIHF